MNLPTANTILLRDYHPADAEGLAAVYRDAVLKTGSKAYDAHQTAVWSLFPEDIDKFRALLNHGLTLVAVQDSRLIAFGQLHPADKIAFIYTAGEYARLGCATKIYQTLEAYAKTQRTPHLRTEASRISRHFFQKMGFRIVTKQITYRHNTPFERFLMEKIIC